MPLVCRPGDCYVYSDLGAIVLGLVVERVTGQGLDVYLHERVFAPLGMTHTFFRPADSLRKKIAPTAITPDGDFMVRGVVNDENAAALGGVAGHAGLFSTAGDLAVFSQMLLNGGVYDGVRIVSDSAVRLFTTRAAGSRALGWAMADGQWGSGRYLSDGSFGHVGFTGTSIWIDPTREMFVILLTNRVYKPKVRGSSKAIADIRADLADAAAVSVTDDPDQLLAMPDSYRSELRHGWNPRPPRRHHYAPHAAQLDVEEQAVERQEDLGQERVREQAVGGARVRSQVTAPAASVTEDQIRLALRRVKDPELNLNIIDIGLVYAITDHRRRRGDRLVADVARLSVAVPRS